MADRQRLVQQAELQLAAGDTAAAQQAFDRAATLVHAADVEMGLVRTYLQAGDYRRALSFASHAAGAHRDVPAGTALYGWLLHIGGQAVFARRVLDEALALWPADQTLQAVRAQTGSAWPQADAALLTAPLRVLPYATGAATPAAAQVVGSALLAGDGRLALAPAALLQSAGAVWVRNGLGQTVAAVPIGPASDPRLTLLRLDRALPLPLPQGLSISARQPFAGSPGYVVEYSFGNGAAMLLRQGFFGRGLAASGEQLLGIDTPTGPRGGPVFDAAGRLAGVALPHADGRDRLLPAASLTRELMLPPAPPPSVERPGVDAIYETALRVALQLLVTR